MSNCLSGLSLSCLPAPYLSLPPSSLPASAPDYDGCSTLPPTKTPHSYPRLKLITFLWTCLGPYSRPYICPFFPRILGTVLAVPFAAISPHTNMPAATTRTPRGVRNQQEGSRICANQPGWRLEPGMVALIDGRAGSQWLGLAPRGVQGGRGKRGLDSARRSLTSAHR